MVRHKDRWALITGVGVGNMAAAIALRFAENGINPILIGHRRESLLETSRTIGERAGMSIRPPVWREVDLAIMAAKTWAASPPST